MDCNSVLHDELKSMGECNFPFCDRLLVEVDKVEVDKAVELCCGKRDMENVNGMNVCLNCGSVYSYDYVTEFFDFYDKMHLIRRKLVYCREYHVENVMNSISFENNVQLTHNQSNKIHKVFVELDSVIPLVNGKRKRMISTKFVIKQIFALLGLPSAFVKIPESKKTLEFYDQYWLKIQSLIGDRIQSIINM